MDNKYGTQLNNHILARYYIYGALFQTIWSIAVLGFTAFLILYFQSYWSLLALGMLVLKPYRILNLSPTNSENIKDKIKESVFPMKDQNK